MIMTPFKMAKMEKHVQEILKELGLPAGSEGLKETPKRFIKYLNEFCQPFEPKELLKDGFAAEGEANSIHSMVVQSNIPFRGMCEHHLAPMLGRAAIGYVPDERVVGLSKLTRLVQAVGTEKPSIQESMCERIANIMVEIVKPKGVIVTISAEHTCMACRGINTPNVITSTSSVRGIFRDVPQARSEFFELIKSTGR